MVSCGVITFFFTNFPSGKSFEELRKYFSKVGDVCDVFIPQKKNRIGKDFGFVRFKGNVDITVLEEKLNSLRIGDCCLRANVARFERKRKEDFKGCCRRRKEECKGCCSFADKIQETLPKVIKSVIAVGEQNEHDKLEQIRKRLLDIKFEVEECLVKLDRKLFSFSELMCSRCFSKGDLSVGEMEHENLKSGTLEPGCVSLSANELGAYGDNGLVMPLNSKTEELQPELRDLVVAAEKEGDFCTNLSDRANVVEEGVNSTVLATKEIKENVDKHQLVVKATQGTSGSEGYAFGELSLGSHPKQNSRRKSDKKMRIKIQIGRRKWSKKNEDNSLKQMEVNDQNLEKREMSTKDESCRNKEKKEDRIARVVNIRSMSDILGIREGERSYIVERRLKEY